MKEAPFIVFIDRVLYKVSGSESKGYKSEWFWTKYSNRFIYCLDQSLILLCNNINYINWLGLASRYLHRNVIKSKRAGCKLEKYLPNSVSGSLT